MACVSLSGLPVSCGCCPDGSIVPCGCETAPGIDETEYGTPPTASELGEQYYSESEGGYDTGFWQGLVNPLLEDIDVNWNQFYEVYGDYLPQDFALGPASLDRASRISDLKEEQFEDQFGRQKNTALQNIGASGFSGSGMQQQTIDDLWSQYSMQHAALGLEEEQSYQDIYSTQGESIISTMQILADLDAFASDEPYESTADAQECVTDCMAGFSSNDMSGYPEALSACIAQCGG